MESKKNARISQEMVVAASRGDADGVEAMLKRGAYPDYALAKGRDGLLAGETALSAACAAGSGACVRLLAPLAGASWRGADGSWSVAARRSLLRAACQGARPGGAVLALLEAGIEPWQEDALDLMSDLTRRRLDGWAQALGALAWRVDVGRAVDGNGDTVLARSASLGDQEAALAVLPAFEKAGALDVKNKDGWSALTRAAQGWPEGVAALIEAGAKDSPDAQGRSALHWAAKRGYAEAARALLKIARPPLQKSGLAPVIAAATAGKSECLGLLINDPVEGAQSRLDEALIWSAHKGELGSMRTLLDAGADPKRAEHGAHRKTALMLAAHRGQLEAAMMLAPLSDTDARDGGGRTALDIAKSSSEGGPVARWLGAWIEAESESGALEAASREGAPSPDKPRL